jgi:hypothetical protein
MAPVPTRRIAITEMGESTEILLPKWIDFKFA